MTWRLVTLPGTVNVPELVSVTVHVEPLNVPGQLEAAAGRASGKAAKKVDDNSAEVPRTAAPRLRQESVIA